ncbi:hypothetical protein PUMCH_002624 [Australozyma saopauloensis]|uniref:54S ribosomal protein L24, mitochondrial n=1 Tax=Australozyma saopauloensis TaxID=291208 RepID=A0AAX4H9T1_9ASCO|nr:hypothetical protein PUMCH_002624 [[Candida] saopauloensis]
MNFLRSFPCVPLAAPTTSAQTGLRTLSSSAVVCGRDKYFKISKYARPIDTTVYQAGDDVPRQTIPADGHKYPKYAYEPMFFKRQNRGLYAGLQRRASNLCSESGNKTKSFHLPNVVKAKLWSETLNKLVCTRVSTTLLRNVDREGGIDNYLLKEKPARVKTIGIKGWQLKYDILKQKELNERSQGSDVPIYHILESGKKITATKEKLLELLFPYVYRENYEPISQKSYLRDHSWLTMEELVVKLEERGFDFSEITV